MNNASFENFRKDFPIFNAKENQNLIYFDNAATSQRPQYVIDAVSNFYKLNNANPLRGLYDLSVRATDEYENAKDLIKDLLDLDELYNSIIKTFEEYIDEIKLEEADLVEKVEG